MNPTQDFFGLVGTTLAGKYRIDGVLGEGGFGVVYRGTHQFLNAAIAVKCMKPLGGSSRDQALAVERFLREAKILFSLTHPSIVRLYDLGTVPTERGTVPYVVLEHIDGGSLEAEIAARADGSNPRPFTAIELLRIFEQVLEAVAYAHESGVAHRDLKPSNVMLGQSTGRPLTVKVVDFGIARWMAEEQKTALGAAAFTPRYAAPEQWDSSLGETGVSSDVFSVGLMVAEACTFRPVISGTAPAQILAEVLRAERRLTIGAQRPDLPPGLEAVVARATALRPSDRFASATEFADALRAVLGEGSSAVISPRLPAVRARAISLADTHVVVDAPTVLEPPIGESSPPQESRGRPASGRVEVSGAGKARRSGGGDAGERNSLNVSKPRDPVLVSSDAAHVLGTWGALVVIVWTGEPTSEAARTLQFTIRDVAATLPSGRVAGLTVVEEGAPMPTSDVRTALANVLRFCSGEIVGSAVALEGDGFRAAAVRGVTTGLSLVARQPFPHKVLGSVDRAAVWLVPHLGQAGMPTTAEELCRAVERLRTMGRGTEGGQTGRHEVIAGHGARRR